MQRKNGHRGRCGRLGLAPAWLTLVGIGLAGCAQQGKTGDPNVAAAYRHVSPALILNGGDGSGLDAQAFSYRRPWPAVQGDTISGQVSYYREYWYDRQGFSPGTWDHSFRLFRGVRVGTQRR